MNLNEINEIMLKLKLNNLIINNYNINLPLDIYDLNNINYYLSNNQNYLIVIESMCLGLFLTDYDIQKIPYFNKLTTNINNFNTNILYYNIDKNTIENNRDNINTYGCNIFIIDKEWDISGWCYDKLTNINKWIHSIPNSIGPLNTRYPKLLIDEVDINFLESLGVQLEY